MTIGLILPLGTLFFSLLLLFVYFSKTRLNNYENKIYKNLIICNFLSLIMEFVCTYFTYNYYSVLSDFIIKFYLVILCFYMLLLTLYISFVSKDKAYLDSKWKYIRIFYFCLFSLVCIIILFGNIDHHTSRYGASATGFSTNVLYFISFCCPISWLYNFFKSKDRIHNRKYLPFIVYLFISLFIAFIQKKYPGLLFVTPMETFVAFLMYFTIENPDMKMVEQLEKAKDDADRANRAKTEFLSSMSHEIRTPLNAIVGFSDCIVNSNNLTDAKENAKDIVNASKTLLEIVNGILDISKIESGKLELVNISYDTRSTLKEVIGMFEPKAVEKGIKFSSYIAPEVPPALYGDVNNIKKIISNLLSNAVKYTDKGFVRCEVTCVNEEEMSKLVIAVEDSGRGIKQEAVKNLFSKFQRLDEDRNSTIEGTGLGLAITKQLVELMGGQIAVHTVYGSGSKFTVMIPQKISTEIVKVAEVVEEEKPKVIKKDVDLKDVKILLVDDNNLNLKVASKLLEKHGANNITCVNSGFDCLDKISMGEKYDLIFMDDMMPKMSGRETFIKLKEMPGFIVPVVALTANAISGAKEEYLELGFSDYLAKPIEKDELVRVLSSVLKEKEEEVSTVTVVENSEIDKGSETKEEYLRKNGVQVDKALELLGDMNMYEVTLKDFLNSIDSKWANIKKYKEEGDLANYSIEVHSLKSDCKYLGFTKLANISFLHELKSKDGDKEYIDKHFVDLENAYDVAIKVMKGV